MVVPPSVWSWWKSCFTDVWVSLCHYVYVCGCVCVCISLRLRVMCRLLNLSWNRLSGPIPSTISALTALTWVIRA